MIKIFYKDRRRFIFLAIALVLFLVLLINNGRNRSVNILSNDVRRGPCNAAPLDGTQECTSENLHSVCFLGKRFCHPGYTGQECEIRLTPANPWYTAHCPNLEQDITYDVSTPLTGLSNGHKCNDKELSGITGCAHLCYSHPVSGVAQVPLAFWKQVQKNENLVWKGGNGGNDRGEEHLEGFNNYKDLPVNLGNYVEVGCGPYTQTQFLADKKFRKITLLDPGIDYYLSNVPGCSYRNGSLLNNKVRLLSYGAEKLKGDVMFGQFDTLLCINVVEHCWDAYEFLTNIYNALKPGGILIYHDRFYPNPVYGDMVLGAGNVYHPVRLTRVVFEHLFKLFETIYMFEGQTHDQIKRMAGEVGFYFIGRKKII